MEITAGPYCSGGSLEDSVYFAGTFAPHRLLIIVPNMLIGRLQRDGAGDADGWTAMFDRQQDAIEAAIHRAIAADDIGRGGWIRLQDRHFPPGSI